MKCWYKMEGTSKARGGHWISNDGVPLKRDLLKFSLDRNNIFKMLVLTPSQLSNSTITTIHMHRSPKVPKSQGVNSRKCRKLNDYWEIT